MPRYRFPVDHSYIPNTLTGDTLASNEARYASALEVGYPKIVQAIESLWGYRELNAYFRKMMIEERSDNVSFSPEVWEEIDLLQHIHEELFPDRKL